MPYITFHEIPDLVPSRRNGSRLHISTVYRWAQKGVNGVKLKSVRIGSQWATKEKWLDDFFLALASADEARAEAQGDTERDEAIEKELRLMGV